MCTSSSGLGGELKLRTGVESLHVENGRVAGVVLQNGETIEAKRVLSSAGWPETMRLCDDGRPSTLQRPPGRLSFCETIATLDVEPKRLGHDRTITFYNDSDKFDWSESRQPCDLRSGVICSPNNFEYDEPLDKEGSGVMITALANFDYSLSLDEEQYQLEKSPW